MAREKHKTIVHDTAVPYSAFKFALTSYLPSYPTRIPSGPSAPRTIVTTASASRPSDTVVRSLIIRALSQLNFGANMITINFVGGERVMILMDIQ